MQHFNSAGILLPGHLGLRPRSSGRAGGPCSGGPQMPRSWTAVRPAGTGNRRPSSALGCHRQSIAAVALSQAGRIPRGPLPFQLFPAEPQRPFLGPRGRGRELPEPFCVPLQTGLRASCLPCPQFTPFVPASMAGGNQTAPLPKVGVCDELAKEPSIITSVSCWAGRSLPACEHWLFRFAEPATAGRSGCAGWQRKVRTPESSVPDNVRAAPFKRR